ncbi:hypothetical protein B4U45_02180 [Mycobacterium persicum]|uniref:Uncharacterized protein n=2 Tax=Mycobacteriaceae TaxID=1762 RepID=A0A8E2IR52_9MYCO|nr:hypothetical protein A4G31_02000 [Mycobacterium persicum]ORB32108.1 hypothetical protein BST40_28070 [Mycobacterium persicum]ORB93572.1 hypothetical protein B1T44_02200 [Mycobacterium persicum]ORC00300.1 hypothetical protein B1T48_01870 [Mycobacterium persicum]ORC05649.1 hypothetical protein B4U45_02180 [Mycobacterium persicum]
MAPSTDPPESRRQFAADVLQKLLRHIVIKNADNAGREVPGCYVFLVSHAWTEGPMMYLVYQAAPSEITWGLVRDTRKSLIDPGPWTDFDDPALYYYFLDFEEGWSGPVCGEPQDDLDTIHWRGDQTEGLPERVSDIPNECRYTPPTMPAPETSRNAALPVADEPRRYVNPL